MQNNHSSDRYNQPTANIDIKRLLRVLWSRWYWVVAAVGLALSGCFLFLKIANPRYVAEVSLRYSEKQSKLDELNSLIAPETASSQEYLAEKYVIESEEVISNAVKKLDYPFTFYAEHTFRREDVYPFQPLRAQVVFYDAGEFGNGTFELTQKGVINYTSEDEKETARFDIAKDTLIAVKGLSFKINAVAQLSQDYTFIHNDLNSIKEAVDDRIGVSEEERNLPIMNVSFTYENQKFAQDFLDKLIESYQEYNLAQKRLSSKLTVDFIQQQIKIYSDALRKASSQVENYKQRRSVPDLQSSMGEVMGRMSELKTQKSTLEIQRSYINLIEESLTTNRNETINLSNIGLDNNTDAVLVRLISDLNKLILERKSMQIRGLSVNNPTVKAADEEIERVRQQILSNIKVQRQKNDGTLEIVNQGLGMLDKRLNSLPSVERELIYLENDREVNQKIYLLLLDKEIEASIVKAGILPSFNILSRTPAYQVYPRPVRMLLIALAMGLAIGLGAIFLARFLNNKFTEIGQIGQHERTQLLGIIQRYPDKVQNSEKDLLQFLEHRSLFAESVNGLRTNLSFLTHQTASNTGKLLVITSEISGEGKSFITINLGISLTKIGKKVLIVVSDLRRSKLHRFFNNNNKVGLSNYLSNKVSDLHKVINHSVVEGLDYVTAGPVPFNPTELIQNERFEQLIAQARQEYDYVLIDTAPIGLVSDNIPLLQKSDLVLFIVRWRYSNKEAHLLAEQMADEYGVKAIGVIVNDFYKDDLYGDLAPSSYYGSRGYGYYYKYTQNYNNSNGYHGESTANGSLWGKVKKWVQKT
ncbi:MAG: polysaccharide biosynthesis tyrosine autokinase [Spirosomaceae bacterium]|nr:polysaccharide biosynthesis tyrosine autokinase [Spirosomataceae bacterium]